MNYCLSSEITSLEDDPDPQWIKLCQETPIWALAKEKNRKVIVLNANLCVREALKVLSENNILSAPVCLGGQKFLGLIDVLDIAAFAYSTWKRESVNLRIPSNHSGRIVLSPPETLFFDAPVKEIINFSKCDEPLLVPYDISLQKLNSLFATPLPFKPHRALLLNENQELCNVVSQSDIISFAYQRKDQIPSRSRKTLRQLNLIRPCIMVRIDSPFSDALQILYLNRVSGIALVDQEGHLRGNFSASDLRGILPDSFHMFYGSTLHFLCKGTQSYPKVPKSCLDTTTLGTALGMLVENHIHRLYIVDELDHPIGIVSLSDIIAVLASHSTVSSTL